MEKINGSISATSAVAYKHRSPAPLGQLEIRAPSTPSHAVARATADSSAPAASGEQGQHPPPSTTEGQAPPAAASQPAGGELARGAAIAALAAGAAAALQAAGMEARVDLKAPGWALVAEALPAKAAPGGLVLTLAAVPAKCLRLKPRLTIAHTAVGS